MTLNLMFMSMPFTSLLFFEKLIFNNQHQTRARLYNDKNAKVIPIRLCRFRKTNRLIFSSWYSRVQKKVMVLFFLMIPWSLSFLNQFFSVSFSYFTKDQPVLSIPLRSYLCLRGSSVYMMPPKQTRKSNMSPNLFSDTKQESRTA